MNSLRTSIENTMFQRQGEIFSIHDFYTLGKKNTVKSALYRLEEENKIARLLEGLYTYPKYSTILQEYAFPDADSVAQKLAEKFSWTIAPSGDTALNYTGLSTQVPNAYVYVSNGPYREYSYRNKKIIFKHSANKNISLASPTLSILVQAIKAIGKNKMQEKEIEKLAAFCKKSPAIPAQEIAKLPVWIYEILKQIQEKAYAKAD